MILNLGSLAFNANIDSGGGTPAWGTELGQGEGYKFAFEDMSDFFTGMVYKSIPDINNVTCPLGKGGNQRADYDFVIASIFDKVFVNGKRVKDARFLLLVVKKLNGDHHVGRRTIKYNPRMTYHGEYINEDCYQKMTSTMGLPIDAAWFVYEIYIENQDQLHFTAYELGQEPQSYRSNDERKNAFMSRLPKDGKRPYNLKKLNDDHLQQIYYGAPGTGKSHEINRLTEGEDVIRTTFHPDSDYSTFVGCYKPTMKVNTISKNGVETQEEQIVYRFVPQTFTKAYTAAWNTTEVVFLIIEEINRGNCAQIFGDLFQLLDRKDGLSEYPVDADSDLADHIRKELTLSPRTDFPEGVKEGKKLVLPSNLFIWATMNTSDQSLFPIDSAFKRRWDWKYMPIENEGKNWKIIVNQHEYDWWDFLVAINKEVFDLTHSEDKQLGYFFAKAKDNTIDAETLVNKVYFYLWTDVFKDYDYESQKAFRKPNSNEPIAFKDFFEKGKVNEVMAEQVLINLELNKPKDNAE